MTGSWQNSAVSIWEDVEEHVSDEDDGQPRGCGKATHHEDVHVFC